ncbi:cell division protein ZapA [Candidatus Poribacteria bacterium]|nr:cell division protein ZapA [Candidatus Poribacteria bacterium]
MGGQSKSIRVNIFGRDYNVKGGPDNEYVKALAEHVDNIMHEIADKTGTLSSGQIAILAALNIADEMYRERQRLNGIAEELAKKLGEVLDAG